MTRGLLPAFAAVLSIAAGTASCCPRAVDLSGLAPGITVAKIRAITVGMNEDQVRGILGPPLAVRDSREGLRSLAYFTEAGPCPYPTLWVRVKEGHVVSVEAKLKRVWDSEGLYVLAADTMWQSRRFASVFPQ